VGGGEEGGEEEEGTFCRRRRREEEGTFCLATREVDLQGNYLLDVSLGNAEELGHLCRTVCFLETCDLPPLVLCEIRWIALHWSSVFDLLARIARRRPHYILLLILHLGRVLLLLGLGGIRGRVSSLGRVRLLLRRGLGGSSVGRGGGLRANE